jgi:hypothetical protein
VQLTIDSSEPLADVAKVVGALYGVELVVADGSEPPAPSRRGGRSGASSRSGRSSRRSRSPRGQAAKVDAKVVRQWAVSQGMTVSSRGQLSRAVLDAYAASNS